MRKIILATLLFTISSLSYANIVRFDIDLKFNKGDISKTAKANVNAKLGSEFFVGRADFKAIFIAKQYTDKNGSMPITKEAITIEAKIYDIKDGKEKLVSSPKIITRYGQEATITAGDKESNEQIEIKITPTQL